MSDMTAQDKKEVISRFIEDVGRMSIMVFHGLDLKTHIEGMVINEDTKEEYIITVNKVSNGKLFKDGGIVFTKQQQDEFAIGFANFVIKEKYTKVYMELFEKKFYVEKTTNELLEIYKQTL